MTEFGTSWWAIRRGPLGFAIPAAAEPSRIPGMDVHWTDMDVRWRGFVSSQHSPIGVRDVAQSLNLPSAPLSEEPWVLASPDDGYDGEEAWALVSDIEPFLIEDPQEMEAPWLPTDVARRLISGALQSASGYYLIIDPVDLAYEEDAPEAEVSEQRIAVRRERIEAVRETEIISPDLLMTSSGGSLWAVDARRIHSVVRIDKISALPGAAHVVSGLATIIGRVNIVVDPTRITEGEPVTTPCWVASVVSDSAKWAIASEGDWEILNTGEYEDVDDHREAPGPKGLIARRVLHDGELINILSIDVLAELAREGADIDDGEGGA